MPAITNLQDLLVNQLRDVYSAERQIVAALPKMAKATTSADLKQALLMHLEETEEHVNRLEQVFEQMGISGRGPKCKGMEGLLEEGKEMLEEDIDENVLDAGIIASAQRVEHYEIAVYGTVVEYARALGLTDVVTTLQSTLDEEKKANDTLTTLAEGGINALAESAGEVDEDTAEEGDGEEDSDVTESAQAGARKKSVGAQTSGTQALGGATKKPVARRR